MKRTLKWAAKWLGIVALVLLVAVLSSPWWFNFNYLRGPVANLITAITGRDAAIERINLDMGWVPVLTVDGISLGNADWATDTPNMVSVKRFQVAIRLKPLLRLQIVVPELLVDTPEISLVRNADGMANWEFGAAEEEESAPPERSDFPIFEHLRLSNGDIRYADETRAFTFVAKIDDFEGNAGGDAPLRVDAKGQLQGEPFTLKAQAGSLLALREDSKPYPLTLDMRVGETHAALDGNIDRPLALWGLNLNLLIEGPNLAALYPVLSLPLPATPPYKLSGLLVHQGSVWGFEGFDGRVGDSDLGGDFKVDIGGDRPKIVADLSSQNLDFKDLGPSIGATDDSETEVSANDEPAAEQEVAAESDSVIPNTEFQLDKLRVADAELKLVAKTINAPNLPINDMNLDLSLENGLMRLQPLQFGVAGGRMNAYATIDASNPTISWDYDVRMRDFRLGELLKSAALEDAGSGVLNGDIKLKARGNALHDMLADGDGRVTMVVSGGRFSNLLLELAGVDIAEALGFLVTEDKKVPIRCMVADLDMQEGKLKSRTLLVDTEDTRINGDLKADFSDESFALRLEPDPKDVSVFSARTPVNISGTFGDIGIAPDYASLGLRAGAAVALGLLATPAAALLAFIEPGLGEDAECDGLLESTEEEPSKSGQPSQTDDTGDLSDAGGTQEED